MNQARLHILFKHKPYLIVSYLVCLSVFQLSVWFHIPPQVYYKDLLEYMHDTD